MVRNWEVRRIDAGLRGERLYIQRIGATTLPNPIVRPLRFSTYTPEYDAVIFVWVNINHNFEEIARAACPNESSDFFAYLAEVWSQGPKETRFTISEVRDLYLQLQKNDPMCWRWLTLQTIKVIRDFLIFQYSAAKGIHLN